EEGNCLWKYKMGDRVDESVPAIYGGRAFILCSDGYLYAFE
ncbi:MAG: PQQ-binding-like beta-propeller repeat protein, partial [Thermoprotei archaeon]|nr:PQQ-binding-like beta-propeller repeat protein [Thermoprotei archaeon]